MIKRDVLLPLLLHLDPQALPGAIRMEKEVECIHLINRGALALWCVQVDRCA